MAENNTETMQRRMKERMRVERIAKTKVAYVIPYKGD
jgi:hypothetical protein